MLTQFNEIKKQQLRCLIFSILVQLEVITLLNPINVLDSAFWQSCNGANEGNRTPVSSMASLCSTIELHLQNHKYYKQKNILQ